MDAPTHVLVKGNRNWADEFNIKFFGVFTIARWTAIKTQALAATHPVTVCFGTNQEIELKNGKDWLSSLEEEEIWSYDADTLVELFGAKGNLSMHERLASGLSTDEPIAGELEVVWGVGIHYFTAYKA